MRENQRLGAARVNLVCADLQRRGIEVFREDGTNSFDLVAHKNGEMLRIEVKGESHRGGNNRFWHDVLAVVGERHIMYKPTLALRLWITKNPEHPRAVFLKGFADVSISKQTRNDTKLEAACLLN